MDRIKSIEVIRYQQDGAAKAETRLVRVYADEPRKVYWGVDGITRCIRPRNAEILHVYSVFRDRDYEARDAIEIDFLRRFRTVVSELKADTEGWLAPDGKFYPCTYAEHDALADTLCAVYYQQLGGVRHLEKMKWLRVRKFGGFDPGGGYDDRKDFTPTQAQIDTVFDLSQMGSKGWRESCLMALEDWTGQDLVPPPEGIDKLVTPSFF